jgi:hypothetical protein
MVFIDPVEQESWDNRRRRATDLNQSQRAQFEFQRGNIQQRQGLDTASLARRFDRMRAQIPGRMAARGLANSGIYKRALTDYGTDRQAASAELAARYQEMLGNNLYQQQQSQINYSNTIGDIDDAERIRRAQIAASLQGLI